MYSDERSRGALLQRPIQKGKDMLEINSKKDAGELVAYLLYLAQGQLTIVIIRI